MKSEHDKEIESFFAQMREKDREIQIPDFPKAKRQRSIYWWIPLGIAASLVTAAWFFARDKAVQPLEQDVIIITLEEKQNNELQFKIERTSELESWESPTSSLLNEF
jgi:flagellar biosynthesis/type III secretory pathway M-ring protein FliF/YscJ